MIENGKPVRLQLMIQELAAKLNRFASAVPGATGVNVSTATGLYNQANAFRNSAVVAFENEWHARGSSCARQGLGKINLALSLIGAF